MDLTIKERKTLNTYSMHIYISPQSDKLEFREGKNSSFYYSGTFEMFFDIHLFHIPKNNTFQ